MQLCITCKEILRVFSLSVWVGLALSNHYLPYDKLDMYIQIATYVAIYHKGVKYTVG